MRSLKPLSEPCFLFPNNGIASEAYEKSGKLVCHVVNSNIAVDTFPTLQISVGVIALFENIYDGDPIFTVISNNGEDVQYRCDLFENFSENSLKGDLSNNTTLNPPLFSLVNTIKSIID